MIEAERKGEHIAMTEEEKIFAKKCLIQENRN